MSDIKYGDHVRITIEGEWGGSDLSEGEMPHSITTLGRYGDDTWTVEKIEPPVVQFQPGDRLRSKVGSAFEVTLGHEGYIHHGAANIFTKYSGGPGKPESMGFNSSRYEKIDLSTTD